MEELYTTWKAIGVAGGDLSFFQDFFVKFYQAFIEGGTAGCNISTASRPPCW